MLNKIKNFMDRPITWGDTIEYAARICAVWGIFLICYYGYHKFNVWKMLKEFESQNKTEERPEW